MAIRLTEPHTARTWTAANGIAARVSVSNRLNAGARLPRGRRPGPAYRAGADLSPCLLRWSWPAHPDAAALLGHRNVFGSDSFPLQAGGRLLTSVARDPRGDAVGGGQHRIGLAAGRSAGRQGRASVYAPGIGRFGHRAGPRVAVMDPEPHGTGLTAVRAPWRSQAFLLLGSRADRAASRARARRDTVDAAGDAAAGGLPSGASYRVDDAAAAAP
jgi:hypothetical protein